MPPINREALTALVGSKGIKKGLITKLFPKLNLCCNADPFNDPGNLDSLSTYVRLAETLTQQIERFQEQIQDLHHQEETYDEDALCALACSHDDELEP